jgi:hypothetical protein
MGDKDLVLDERVFCEICKEQILDEELQVWLQTKNKEFEEWNFVEDLKFHNFCWVEKMKSIRTRGQNDSLVAVTKGIKDTIKNAQGDNGDTPFLIN